MAYLDVVTGKPYGTEREVTGYEELVRKIDGGGSLTVVCASAQLYEVQEIAAEIVVSRIADWREQKGGAYDQVIIDCPPNISSLSLAALRAADDILVPATADVFSIRGLPILLRAIDKYREVLDIDATIAGVVLSMFPPAAKVDERTVAEEYATQIGAFCATAERRLLTARVSRNDAYPASFASREPLAFSTSSQHVSLIKELQEIASELDLLGGIS